MCDPSCLLVVLSVVLVLIFLSRAAMLLTDGAFEGCLGRSEAVLSGILVKYGIAKAFWLVLRVGSWMSTRYGNSKVESSSACRPPITESGESTEICDMGKKEMITCISKSGSSTLHDLIRHDHHISSIFPASPPYQTKCNLKNVR